MRYDDQSNCGYDNRRARRRSPPPGQHPNQNNNGRYRVPAKQMRELEEMYKELLSDGWSESEAAKFLDQKVYEALKRQGKVDDDHIPAYSNESTRSPPRRPRAPSPLRTSSSKGDNKNRDRQASPSSWEGRTSSASYDNRQRRQQGHPPPPFARDDRSNFPSYDDPPEQPPYPASSPPRLSHEREFRASPYMNDYPQRRDRDPSPPPSSYKREATSASYDYPRNFHRQPSPLPSSRDRGLNSTSYAELPKRLSRLTTLRKEDEEMFRRRLRELSAEGKSYDQARTIIVDEIETQEARVRSGSGGTSSFSEKYDDKFYPKRSSGPSRTTVSSAKESDREFFSRKVKELHADGLPYNHARAVAEEEMAARASRSSSFHRCYNK